MSAVAAKGPRLTFFFARASAKVTNTAAINNPVKTISLLIQDEPKLRIVLSAFNGVPK